jgi:hypothetical protein
MRSFSAGLIEEEFAGGAVPVEVKRKERIMNCPVCSKAMVEKDFGGVRVDVCQDGCKGIWFDWMELIKLDEQNEGLRA